MRPKRPKIVHLNFNCFINAKKSLNFLRKSESASAFGPVQVRQAGRQATPTATRPRSHLIKYDKAALGPGKKLSASISLV